MSEKPDILETLAAEEAKLLEEAAKVRRKREDITRLAELAAEFNLVLTPAAGAQPAGPPLETISDLIQAYKTSVRSPYQKLSHASKTHYNALLNMIGNEHGKDKLSSLQLQDCQRWHEEWRAGGKVAIAHAKIQMVRSLVGFGTVLQNDACQRLFGILCKWKVKAPKGRTERLTVAQANLIRATARQLNRPSVALAQAFQSDFSLLQKDVIGEWVPISEKTPITDITADDTKWVRGLRWSEIDDEFILRHTSDSPWPGNAECDLRQAPAVLEELRIQFGFNIDKSSRDDLPKSGAIIRSEHHGQPWSAIEFRRWWRKIADACGVPKTVRNSDSRSRVKESASQEFDENKERIAK